MRRPPSPRAPKSSSAPFDAGYYRRFYTNLRTRVTTPEESSRRATLIAAVMQQLELPVRRILDAGCGLGLMRPTLLSAFPSARYVGLEVSEHLCRQLGWVQASLAGFKARAPFDLIICNDVLQYLTDREAACALANLGRLCRGALYFHALTTEDWQRNADTRCSDGNVYFRSADWHRQRLARSFRFVGFGMHVRRGVPIFQWQLEQPSMLT
jgi:predicted TPR repeat methyltransferase